ncbi:MAG: gliding motility-associated protein GldE [Flavobacteriales bacterium]|nr:gliding motility-associated protein GldE [Flavobacteriales bacterium]
MEPPPESFLFLSSILQPFSFEAIIGILPLIVLLICSGLISGSEIAFFSINPAMVNSMEENKTKKYSLVIDLLKRPKRLLATILIANNFINVAIIILSSAITNTIFNFKGNELIGFIFQVIVITFLILLFGEVIPKVYANKNVLKLSALMAFPMTVMLKLFYPLSSTMVSATSFIDKRFKKRSENISVDELSHALELTSDENADDEEKKILTGIVQFGNTDVKQIMTPRMDVFTIEITENFQSVKEFILDAGYSRIPVYKENFDKIEGVLYVKDLLPHIDENQNFNWQQMLRSPFFVPENKKIDDLLKEFQEKKIHLAIVVDEYGGSSGLVALEDIIEEIVGDISDEFDDDDITYSKLDEENFIFEGKIALKDFYRLIEIEGDEFENAKGDSDSLAGFIIELEGKIPKKGEQIAFKNYVFTIEAANARKISTIKVTLPQSVTDEQNEATD